MGSDRSGILTERGRKFVVDVNWSLLSLLMLTATAVLIRIVLARWLEPDGFGLLSMVINLQGLAVIVAGFGLPMALTKFVAEGKGEGGIPPACALAGSLALGVVAALCLYHLAGPISRLYRMPRLAGLVSLLAFALPFNCCTETLLGLFNGLRSMRSYACLVSGRSASMLLFSWVLVFLGFGVEGAVWGIVLSAALTSLFGAYCARSHLSCGVRGGYRALRRLLTFGSRIFASNAVSELVNRADLLLVGYFLSAAQVGFYSSATSISALLLIIPSAIQKVSYPAASAYWTGNDRDALRRMADKTMKYSACLLLPAGLATLFFGRQIIALIFGAPYLDAYLPLCILLIPRALGGATLVPVGSLFSGIGRPEISMRIDSCVCAVNVLLNLALIPRYGMAGAAAALAAAQLCGYCCALTLLVRVAGIVIDLAWFSRALGAAALAAASFLLGDRYFAGPFWALALLAGYLLFIFVFLLTVEDKRMLGSAAHSLVSRSRRGVASMKEDPMSTTAASNRGQAAPEPPPFVSVAVVVRDEGTHIAACLEALERQDYPRERFEVLVVDGGSTDGTVPIVAAFSERFPNLRLIECPGCSYPAGLNIALRQARGEIWAFVDGHAAVQLDHISRNVAHLEESGAACVGGVIRTTGEGYLGAAIAYALSTPFGVGNARFRYSARRLPEGCFVDTVPYGAYRKKVVLAAGGFDERRLRSADIELHHRIRSMGGTFYLAPDLCTRYFSRPTLAGMVRQAYANGYPLARTARAASARHFVPALFVAALLATLLLSPFASLARGAFLGIVGAYLAADLLFAALAARENGWRYLPALLCIYPLLHLSYGAGSLAGVLQEVLGTTAPAERGCAPREG